MSPKLAYGFIYRTLFCQSREAILALQQPTYATTDDTLDPRRTLGASQSPVSAAEQRSLDRIQHHVEILAHIFGEEAQHEITILLQQLVLAPVATVGIGTFQVLRTLVA